MEAVSEIISFKFQVLEKKGKNNFANLWENFIANDLKILHRIVF